MRTPVLRPATAILATLVLALVALGTAAPVVASTTKMVKDINPGKKSTVQGRGCDYLLKHRGEVIFGTNDRPDTTPGRKQWLWKSDGSKRGTTRLAFGPFQDQVCEIARLGRVAIIGASETQGKKTVWRTNLERSGTYKLKGKSGSPRRVDDLVYFNGNTTFGLPQLWQTDGTRSDTQASGKPWVVLDGPRMDGAAWNCSRDGLTKVDLDTLAAIVARPNGPDFQCVHVRTKLGGRLIIVASDETHGRELWRSDGTAAGTVMVKDINPGAGDSLYTGGAFGFRDQVFANVGGVILFVAHDGEHDEELWRTDGTAAGTSLVRDINPSKAKWGSSISGMTDLNGRLIFSADDGVHGLELWRSDGTRRGTRLVKDIRPGAHASKGPNASRPGGLTRVGRRVYFAAGQYPIGRELWQTDGTRGGTKLVKDIQRTHRRGSHPRHLTAVNGTLFFSADDGKHGRELWKHVP